MPAAAAKSLASGRGITKHHVDTNSFVPYIWRKHALVGALQVVALMALTVISGDRWICPCTRAPLSFERERTAVFDPNLSETLPPYPLVLFHGRGAHESVECWLLTSCAPKVGHSCCSQCRTSPVLLLPLQLGGPSVCLRNIARQCCSHGDLDALADCYHNLKSSPSCASGRAMQRVGCLRVVVNEPTWNSVRASANGRSMLRIHVCHFSMNNATNTGTTDGTTSTNVTNPRCCTTCTRTCRALRLGWSPTIQCMPAMRVCELGAGNVAVQFRVFRVGGTLVSRLITPHGQPDGVPTSATSSCLLNVSMREARIHLRLQVYAAK